MPKHTYFQKEWLSNSKYKLWIARVKGTKIASCNLCKSDISLSNMGSSALDDHACGKKHKQKVKERQQSLSLYFKSNTCSTSKE